MSHHKPKTPQKHFKQYRKGRAMAERRYDPKRGKREMDVYRELMGDDDDKPKGGNKRGGDVP